MIIFIFFINLINKFIHLKILINIKIMEEYKEIINWYNSTLIFKLSQIGYALNCNLIFTDRLQYLNMDKSLQLITYLKDGDKIF